MESGKITPAHLRLSPQRAKKIGIVDRDYMKTFFAARIQPHGDFGIGEAVPSGTSSSRRSAVERNRSCVAQDRVPSQPRE